MLLPVRWLARQFHAVVAAVRLSHCALTPRIVIRCILGAAHQPKFSFGVRPASSTSCVWTTRPTRYAAECRDHAHMRDKPYLSGCGWLPCQPASQAGTRSASKAIYRSKFNCLRQEGCCVTALVPSTFILLSQEYLKIGRIFGPVDEQELSGVTLLTSNNFITTVQL
jgi:hypothetical protein